MVKLNKFLLIIILFLGILLLYTLYKFKYKKYENYIEFKIINNDLKIPRVIFQTYISIDRVPKKVFDNLKKYTNNYDYKFYNDSECLEFLKTYYDDRIVNTYNKIINKAHKADLFRYCLLYEYGGIYLDIKTELLKPINQIITSNYTYTAICGSDDCIYQGVIATQKKNPIFPILIEKIINTVEKYSRFPYYTFIRQFYKLIKDNCKISGKIKPGINKNYIDNQDDYYLFYEKCSRNPKDCYDGLDRHNYCCYIYDNNTKIIKTRYADFPW